MRVEKTDRRKTSFFSGIANDLVYDQHALNEFLNNSFIEENLIKQAAEKKSSYSSEFREKLKEVLLAQHKSYLHYEKIDRHLQELSNDKTFTVTTGHQLSLYGGPQYVVYKIIHAIRLSEELNKKQSEYKFIPVFWLASEDHDFEEINHIHLFNDTLVWESAQKGPVGRFNLRDIDEFRNQVLHKFENNPSFSAYLNNFYRNDELSFSEATRKFLLDLFGERGLIIIDGDDLSLKSLFAPVIRKELKEGFSGKAVQERTDRLTESGYKAQVHPREINLFYIEKGRRDRIIAGDDGGFEVGEDRFSREQLVELLEKDPQKFSPNVVLRTVYQEYILPNICYLGGGGEMAYWLQLKSVFDEIALPFPVIAVRNSVQWFDELSLKKMDKLNLSPKAMFKDMEENKKKYVLENAEEELDFTELEKTGEELKNRMEALISKVDKGLNAYAQSESVKISKQMEQIKQKMIRHQKKKNEEAMQQIENLYERLFPAQGLQERYETIIPLMARYGKEELLEILYKSLDPFEKDLILLLQTD